MKISKYPQKWKSPGGPSPSFLTIHFILILFLRTASGPFLYADSFTDSFVQVSSPRTWVGQCWATRRPLGPTLEKLMAQWGGQGKSIFPLTTIKNPAFRSLCLRLSNSNSLTFLPQKYFPPTWSGLPLHYWGKQQEHKLGLDSEIQILALALHRWASLAKSLSSPSLICKMG